MSKLLIDKILNLLLLGRYDKPYGSLLLMWPCLWGLGYADKILKVDTLHFLLLILGSFVMRGAGCTINDILDVKYDRKVSRTKSRPLACKKINLYEAILFLLFQLLVGLTIVINFSVSTIVISFLVIPLVFIYPLFKRFSSYPQLVLGLIYNWGIIVGFSFSNVLVDYEIFFLYLAGVFLTIGYDTIYAFQDIRDDAKIGVKSLALKVQKFPKLSISIIYLISFLFFLLFFFKVQEETYLSILFLFLIFLHMFYQIKKIKLKDIALLQKVFISNVYLGGIIFLGIII